MSVATFTKSGTKAQTPAKLDKKVFNVEIKNHQLLKEAYLAYLANGRSSYAVTKSRGAVRGGGAKPWRQKGTGRARVGSSRNPIWRGGGVAFGPTGEENYSHKINIKAKRLALRQALTTAANENRIKVIEAFVSKEGKTKDAIKLLEKIDAKGTVLLITSVKDEATLRAIRNLPSVKAVQARQFHVFDILNADHIVVTSEALELIHEWLTPSTHSTNAQGRPEGTRRATGAGQGGKNE